MAHSFCCFPCSWILFPCLYFTIIVKSRFFILFSAKDSVLFMINSISHFKFSSTSFRKSKLKKKKLWVSYHDHIFFHYYTFLHDYNDFIKLLKPFLVILLCWYKRYNIFLISFFNLYEFFWAFICANNVGSLVNNLFGVKILILFHFFTSLLLSNDDMSSKSSSYDFYLLNFTLSAMLQFTISSGHNLLFSSFFDNQIFDLVKVDS